MTGRRGAALAVCCAALALGACSHAPAPAPAQRGGYYLDDGPGAGPAPDPASVADAVPRAEPLLARTMRPYSVFGREYVPMTRLAPYRERGTASWYGRRYHGQPTSSGERYDMYAMTAAHPTLPIPSYVRVTHAGNGRSVVVRVNDRGPFLHGRVIDLSYIAAAKLGFVAAGSAEVDVELVTRFDAGVPQPVAEAASAGGAASVGGAVPQPPPGASAPAQDDAAPRLELETSVAAPAAPAAPAPRARGFWLQLGAFASLDNARSAARRLEREFDWGGSALAIVPDGGLYKVQAGPWTRREQAAAQAERVRAATGLRAFPAFR